MYSEKELRELVKKIERDYMYSDLDITERVFIITRLLNHTRDLNFPHILDEKNSEKYMGEIIKALNILIGLENEYYVSNKTLK